MCSIRNGMDASALTDAAWIRSRHSGPTGGNCVEVANAAGVVVVRDTKDRDGAVLGIPAAAWRAFTDAHK